MPLVGLLSDSHGRASTTRRGVERLIGQGVDLLIHLGDVGSVEVIDALLVPAKDGQGILETHLVFGNTDWDLDSLARYAGDVGVWVDHPVGTLEIAGKKLVFQHGDDSQAMRDAVRDGADYLCHGHTHRPAATKSGSCLVVNPGALFRATNYTVATLDPDSGDVHFLTV